MSFLEIVGTLLLKPLQLIFEIIYMVTNRLIGNPGVSIAVLSFVMNLLVLPLYRRADAMQEEERRMEVKLQKGVAHIKKTFKGDEQMLMIRTYYRQNDYKPVYILRGTVSLFLEIPFFIAAYRFLSGLDLLNGVAFGPIPDLGSPDAMFQFSRLHINVLPFIMTAVNLVSCIIFTKGSPAKTKIQLYGMAVFFLIFLYDSPSGLVFYWTLNNIFSLVKTIFYKLKNPKKVISLISTITGVGIFIYGILGHASSKPRLMLFLGILGILMQFPMVYTYVENHGYIKTEKTVRAVNIKSFLMGGLFLSILTGILIPSAVIKSSPQEFVRTTLFYHPIWFIVSSFCMALGIFVIWMGVFYWLAGSFTKPFFDRAVWIFSGIALIDYMFFNKNFGNLSSRLKYEKELAYSITEQLWNLMLILVTALVLYIIYEYFEKKIYEILIIGSVAVIAMSIFNITHIQTSIEAVNDQMTDTTVMPDFNLSKSGKNIIVFMLDRAMGEQIPYIFNEKPELKEQFDGFTHYSNVISFGPTTNLGFPALVGGYEYTPMEMNKRTDEPLVSKHNEALKVMPVLFDQNGYEVTVINPAYANYQWIPDLTIYADYPDIKSYITGDKFVDSKNVNLFIENNKRNFFCYSILKSMPLFARETIYDSGRYNQMDDVQNITSVFTSEGINADFMESYSVLENLCNIGNVVDEEKNTFLLLVNDATHEPMLLQEPDYVPSARVDNTKYEESQPGRILDGTVLKLENEYQMIHYHANMAAMIQLGKWFDYMRQEGVYDNTRIVLVSDHGQGNRSLEELILDNGTCVSSFYPILMVKDFGSRDFVTSDIFMTNADVPVIATEGIIDQPVNPFTGKVISSDEKIAHDQYILSSFEWDTDINNGNTFIPADWYSVHDDIWNKSNWKLVAENAVSPEVDY